MHQKVEDKMATLYTKEQCPACEAVKREISRAGLQGIAIKNIDRDPSAYSEVTRIGARVVPVLIDDKGRVHLNTTECLRALGLR